MAPSFEALTPPSETIDTPNGNKVQPWKKWLAEEIKAPSEGKAKDVEQRLWTSWKSDP